MLSDEDLTQLEWWANPSTCRARVPVVLEAAHDGTWIAFHSPELDVETHDSLRFLIDMGPDFSLRFRDGSVIPVVVGYSDDTNRLCVRGTSGHRLKDTVPCAGEIGEERPPQGGFREQCSS